MKLKTRLKQAVPILAVAAGLAALPHASADATLAGKHAPSFAAQDMTGHKWSLAALKGRPVVLDFWAFW